MPPSTALPGSQALLADLATLATEATRRRLAPLKEAADRATAQLSAATGDAAAMSEVWYPFALACEVLRGTRFVIPCASSLGRLANAGLLRAAQLPLATQMLRAAVHHDVAQSQPDAEFQTRAVQTVAAFCQAAPPSQLAAPLSLGLELHATGTGPVVRNAARAAVQQSAETLLAQLVVCQGPGGEREGSEEQALADHMAAVCFFRDVCAVLCGAQPKWLPQLPMACVQDPALQATLLDIVADAIPDPAAAPPALSPHFSQCLNEDFLQLVLALPAYEDAPALFTKGHRLAVRLLCAFLPAINPAIIAAVLGRHAHIILRSAAATPSVDAARAVLRSPHTLPATVGGTSPPPPAAVAAEVSPLQQRIGSSGNLQSGNASFDADAASAAVESAAAAPGILVVVGAWRRAIATPRFLSRLMQVEVANNPALAELLDDAAAASEVWERTAVVRLLLAPTWLLDALLQDPAATRPASLPFVPELAMALLEYATALAQGLVRWLEGLHGRTVVVTPRVESRASAGDAPAEAVAEGLIASEAFRAVWPTLRRCAANALTDTEGPIGTDDAVHHALKVCSHMVHYACMAGDVAARDSFLELLLDQLPAPGGPGPAPLDLSPSLGGTSPNAESTLAQRRSLAGSLRLPDDLTRSTRSAVPPALSPPGHPGAGPPDAAAMQRRVHLLGCVVSIASAMGNALGDGWAPVVRSLVSAQAMLAGPEAEHPAVAVEVTALRAATAHVFLESPVLMQSHTLGCVAEHLALVVAGTPQPLLSPTSGGSPGQHVDPYDAALPGEAGPSSDVDAASVTFVSQCFAQLVQAHVAHGAAATDPAVVVDAAARVSECVWPSLRRFVIAATAVPGGDTPLSGVITAVGDTVGAVCTWADMSSGPTEATEARRAALRTLLPLPMSLLAELFQRAESLFSASAALSVAAGRQRIVSEISRCVKVHGQRILSDDAWRHVFRVAELASTTGAEEAVLAFRVVELAHHGCIAVLGEDALPALVAATGAFVRQRVADKVSVNLSAVQLAWAAADYLVSQDREGGGSREDADGPDGPPADVAAARDQARCHAWGSLLRQLRDGGVDDRAEVRHSALKSLLSLVVAHGSALPASCWPALVAEVFPAVLCAALDPETLSSTGGATPKQLDEVQVAAIDATGRVLRLFPAAIAAHVPDAPAAVRRLLILLLRALAAATTETVIVAANKAVGGLLVELAVARGAGPRLLGLDAADLCLAGFEGLLQRARDDTAAVTLAALKIIVDSTADAAAAALEANAEGEAPWRDPNAAATVLHRVLALWEHVLDAPPVAATYMFPCAPQVSVLGGVARLTQGLAGEAGLAWLPAASAQGDAWRSVLGLFLAQLPAPAVVAAAVAAPRSAAAFPKRHHPNFVAAVCRALPRLLALLPRPLAGDGEAAQLGRALGALLLLSCAADQDAIVVAVAEAAHTALLALLAKGFGVDAIDRGAVPTALPAALVAPLADATRAVVAAAAVLEVPPPLALSVVDDIGVVAQLLMAAPGGGDSLAADLLAALLPPSGSAAGAVPAAAGALLMELASKSPTPALRTAGRAAMAQRMRHLVAAFVAAPDDASAAALSVAVADVTAGADPTLIARVAPVLVPLVESDHRGLRCAITPLLTAALRLLPADEGGL